MSSLLRNPILNPLKEVYVGAKLYRVVTINAQIEGTKSMLGMPALEILEVDGVKRSDDRQSLLVDATYVDKFGNPIPTSERYPKASIGNINIAIDQTGIKFKEGVYTTEEQLAFDEIDRRCEDGKDEAQAYIKAYEDFISNLDAIRATLSYE